MITFDDMLQLIADLERNTFSDNWSKESLEDTASHDYNNIYVALDCGDRISVIKLPSLPSDGKLEDNLLESVTADEIFIFAGYLIANVVGDETELLRIAVKRELRGKGIALKLMDYYFAQVKASGVRGFLEVRESNTPARSLYEKEGYKKIATRKNYYSNPPENGVIYQITF